MRALWSDLFRVLVPTAVFFALIYLVLFKAILRRSIDKMCLLEAFFAAWVLVGILPDIILKRPLWMMKTDNDAVLYLLWIMGCSLISLLVFFAVSISKSKT